MSLRKKKTRFEIDKKFEKYANRYKSHYVKQNTKFIIKLYKFKNDIKKIIDNIIEKMINSITTKMKIMLQMIR